MQESGFAFARRGVAPEYQYFDNGAIGPLYDPDIHNRLLIPTTVAFGPRLTMQDFIKAAELVSRGKILVLTFHGIPDVLHPWVSTSPEMFARMMKYLKQNDFKVIALQDLKQFGL